MSWEAAEEEGDGAKIMKVITRTLRPQRRPKQGRREEGGLSDGAWDPGGSGPMKAGLKKKKRAAGQEQ